MFCITRKRMLFLLILGLVMMFGVAYAFDWRIVFGYAPFLLMLLCPLIHLFGGHGHHENIGSPKGKHQHSCH